MTLADDLWLRPIIVEPHAAGRIRDRVGNGAEERVVGEVRLALLEGRASEVQPPWTRHRARAGAYATPVGRLYAWEPSFVRCWVVQRRGHALVVVTVLLERGERAVAAQRRRIRA